MDRPPPPRASPRPTTSEGIRSSASVLVWVELFGSPWPFGFTVVSSAITTPRSIVVCQNGSPSTRVPRLLELILPTQGIQGQAAWRRAKWTTVHPPFMRTMPTISLRPGEDARACLKRYGIASLSATNRTGPLAVSDPPGSALAVVSPTAGCLAISGQTTLHHLRWCRTRSPISSIAHT